MADILIRGMEMPKSCDDCFLPLRYCPYAMKENGECPILPLPEGHGDLIDRDALRAENGLNAKCEHCPTNTYKCQNDMIHTKMDFCEMLDDATVIVPAEGGTDDGDE